MTIELASIDENVWDQFASASVQSDHDLRYLSLATLSDGKVPVSRLLVLRGLDRSDRTLIFHTDTMSEKWSELTAYPKASVLGFSAEKGEQFRFEGSVELYAPSTELNQSEWDKLSVWSQNTYCGGPPGEEAQAPSSDLQKDLQPPSDAELERGRSRFGVLKFKANNLDWFRLQRSDNRRAKFFYNASGGIENASWINP
ncbi:MAG: pyridoxamine 5'-phosphate oxidase family protein [Lentilitoribacter sp.]